MTWVYFSFLLTFELLADIFSKKYSLNASLKNWVLAILGFIIANTFWLAAMRHGIGLGRGVALFGIVQMVLGCLLGLIYYREMISTTQICGLVLGVIAVVLLVKA